MLRAAAGDAACGDRVAVKAQGVREEDSPTHTACSAPAPPDAAPPAPHDFHSAKHCYWMRLTDFHLKNLSWKRLTSRRARSTAGTMKPLSLECLRHSSVCPG